MHLSTTEYSVCIPKITAKSQDIISSGTRGASMDPQLDPRNRHRTTELPPELPYDRRQAGKAHGNTHSLQ